jgi:DNA mismatch repair ATPase MutL
MGWKATFSKDNLNTTLLQKVKVDASVWGKTHDAMTSKETAEKMGRAAIELRKCAAPTLFTKLIPTLNKSAPECKRVLDKMRAMLSENRSEPGPSRPQPAASSAQMAMSDEDSDDDDDDAPVPPPPKPTPPAKPAPKARAPPKQKAAPPPKRARKRNDSDSESDDESEVSKEDADLSRVVHTSDEEDSSSSSSSESDGEESEDSDSDAEPPPAAAPAAAPVPVARLVAAANTPAQEQLVVAQNREQHVVTLAAAAARETILDTFKEQAAPCCEHMQDWMRANQLTTSQERMNAISRDVERLQRGDSAAGMMAAALRLVEAMAGAHADRESGATVPIDREVKERASNAVYKAKEFTATTLEQVEDMIGQLEKIQQHGCSVQECISRVGVQPSAPQSA